MIIILDMMNSNMNDAPLVGVPRSRHRHETLTVTVRNTTGR